MKFSEQWLRSLVDPPLTTAALAQEMTMAGLEVEAIEPAAREFSGVVVGEILSVGPHPGADRLSVCRVEVGDRQPRTIVCGAPNVAEGERIPCAVPGAKLPGMEIREATVRGVTSSGMLCSARELGIGEDTSGLLVLPSDAPVGADFRTYYGLEDRIFTLKLTANRGDCLSVIGVAREVAALTGTSMAPLEAHAVPASIQDALPIAIEAQDACRRYCGRVVRNMNAAARTPLWMVRRLEKSGVRAITPVVDATNYVMLELGQPLHAFDLGRLEGGIHVRFARPGERLLALNGQDLELASDYLVIADAAGPVALAGIMGGAPTAVDKDTVDVFLESAYFDPKAIAGRSRRLGFGTDSSHRFERGVDFQVTAQAIERATALVLEICGGAPGPITEARTELPMRAPVRLRTARVPQVLGTDIEADQIAAIFERLSMSVQRGGDTLVVTPPSFRFDIAVEEDLIEEVARVHGYDRIAPKPNTTQAATMLGSSEAKRSPRDLRSVLVHRDYQEVITYAFVDPAWESDFGSPHPLRLANPIASQMSVMRTTLAGGLIDRLRFNLNRRQSRVRLFEIGTVFLGTAGELQPVRIGGLAYGDVLPEQWGAATRKADLFDVMADIEALGLPFSVTCEPATHPALHPGRSARVYRDAESIGWIGELHPAWQVSYELPLAPVLFEVDVLPLLRLPVPAYREISRFPQLRRDLAFVIDAKVAAGALLSCLRAAASEVVTEVGLFDMYCGKGLDNGKKSLAFRVLLQDTRKTLTDEEADAAVALLVAAAEEKYGASLRR